MPTLAQKVRSLGAKALALLGAAGAGGVLAWFLVAYPTASALWQGVTGGASMQAVPGKPYVPPPAPAVKKWKHAPAAPDAKPVPHLEPANPSDLAKLDKKLGLHGELGKTKDVISSAATPCGDAFTVAPRDGSPAETIFVEPRFKVGGKLWLEGQALLDFKGKVQAGHAALLADLVRVGKLQVSGGPAVLYSQPNGATAGVLVRGALYLRGL